VKYNFVVAAMIPPLEVEDCSIFVLMMNDKDLPLPFILFVLYRNLNLTIVAL
jgi:hypothetical protein